MRDRSYRRPAAALLVVVGLAVAAPTGARAGKLSWLDDVVREVVREAIGARMEGSFAMLCNGKGCLPPVKTVDELIKAMNSAL